MARFKDGGRVPEGFYLFKIMKEPTFKKYGGMIAVELFLKVTAENGDVIEENWRQSPPRWECGNLWRALGFEKDKEGYWDIDESACVGKTFEGDVVYEQDRKDPDKSWPRIRNIVIPKLSDPRLSEDEEEETEAKDKDDDVPF